MPYIKKANRIHCENVIKAMEDAVVIADGDLNYILYAFCKRNVKPSYNNYKNFCGELRQCATEIERRLLADYEDTKIKENGDVELAPTPMDVNSEFDSICGSPFYIKG